jgi:predicted nucleic acid-binding protein
MLDIPEGEKVYIDSSIWIIHHSKDLPFKKGCTEFLRSVELGKHRAFISTLVVDEVTYILLKQKASEILAENRHYKILKELKRDGNLFSQCWRTAQLHVNYVLGLKEKGVLRIITQMPDLETFSSAIEKYHLLPRNATHLSIIFSLNIPNIVTTDSDFDKVKEIKAWKP